MKYPGWLLLGLLTPSLVACGGAPPPPAEEPKPEWESTQAEGAAKPTALESDMAMEGMGEAEEDEDGSGVVHEPQAEAEPEPASEPKVQKPSRPPVEILTGAKISFMINYPASALSKAAEQKCSKQFGEDLAAVAKCKSEARKEFIADVLLFKKNTQGSYDWYVYRRSRDDLFEVSTSRVEFTKETENTLTLKVAGKGSGARPLFVGASEIPVSVPGDSSIELDDPVLGHLVYEAKIGLVGN